MARIPTTMLRFKRPLSVDLYVEAMVDKARIAAPRLRQLAQIQETVA